MLTLDEINQLDQKSFTRAFEFLFEGPAWVVEKAWEARPFQTLEQLHQALCQVIAQAPVEQQIALLQTCPDLAGHATRTGTLPSASKNEQANAQLNDLSPDEIALFTRLNQEYRDRFGFPLVMCARLNKKASILAGFEARLQNSRQQEIATALGEIAKICSLRLRDLVRDEEAMEHQEQIDFYAESLNVQEYIMGRETGRSRNELVEEPAFLQLLGSDHLAGQRCLDLGCGYGHYSRILAERGANVLAIDRSVLMLQQARERNAHRHITYQQMDICEAAFADGSFDLIISNLAFHYIADLTSLFQILYRSLKRTGSLVFTVEHPIFTANRSMLTRQWCDGDVRLQWVISDYGEARSQWIVSNYFDPGLRPGPFGLRYHHTFQDYFTSITAVGFQVSTIIEPQPSQEHLRINPSLSQDLHRPFYLGFRCWKMEM